MGYINCSQIIDIVSFYLNAQTASLIVKATLKPNINPETGMICNIAAQRDSRIR